MSIAALLVNLARQLRPIQTADYHLRYNAVRRGTILGPVTDVRYQLISGVSADGLTMEFSCNVHWTVVTLDICFFTSESIARAGVREKDTLCIGWNSGKLPRRYLEPSQSCMRHQKLRCMDLPRKVQALVQHSTQPQGGCSQQN